MEIMPLTCCISPVGWTEVLTEPWSGLTSRDLAAVQCSLWISEQSLSCLYGGKSFLGESQVPVCEVMFPALDVCLQQWSGQLLTEPCSQAQSPAPPSASTEIHQESGPERWYSGESPRLVCSRPAWESKKREEIYQGPSLELASEPSGGRKCLVLGNPRHVPIKLHLRVLQKPPSRECRASHGPREVSN